MAQLIGTTTFVATEDGIAVQGFGLAIDIMNAVSDALRAGDFRVPAGVITIYLPGPPHAPTLRNLLSIPANRSLDVMIYLSLDAVTTAAIMNINTGTPMPDPETALTTRSLKVAELAMIIATYLGHGTIANLTKPIAMPIAFASKAVGQPGQTFTIVSVTSLSKIDNLRFPGLVNNAKAIVRTMHSTFQQRMALGVGGNRMFSIAKRIVDKCPIRDTMPEVVHFMLDPEILSLAPFISFHPDHPANPTANSAKSMLAVLGQLGRNNNFNWAVEFEADKGLYIAPVRAYIQTEFVPALHHLPVIGAFIAACDPAYSMVNL